jgi:tRNA pseudouridine13 synthase
MIDSQLDLRLPYLTNALPGIGGELRVTPDDFVVEEIPLYLPQGEGQHLYVCLTKAGSTTKEIQRQLEQLFGLRRGEVGFAGLKDKQARTTQTFSLNVGHQPAGYAEDAARRIADALAVEVHWAKFHRNKLQPGHLLGNRFVIRVAKLACGREEAEARVAAIVQVIQARGIPNFFGPQRFGINGGNVRQGLELLIGARRQQDRWLRRFLISGYQSYLCNRYLARRVEMGAFDHLLLGDVAKKVATGGMFNVEDVAQEQPRYARQEISFTAPLFGPKMWEAQAEAGALEASVLAEAPVTLEQLAAARVEGTRRLGRLLVNDLVAGVEQAGDAPNLRVEFQLPKGAFATTVLREVMKVDLAALPALDDEEDA